MASRTPRRNLPPEAEPWGRYVNAEIEAIKRRLGITSNNVNSVKQQGYATLSSVAQAVTDINDQIDTLEPGTDTVLAPKEPDTAAPGDQWVDTSDNNLLKIRVDYGISQRYNYVLNPAFTETTDGWTVEGGTLSLSAGRAAIDSDGITDTVTLSETATHQDTYTEPVYDLATDTVTESEPIPAERFWSASARVVTGGIAVLRVVDTVTGAVVAESSGDAVNGRIYATPVAETGTSNPVRVVVEVSGLLTTETPLDPLDPAPVGSDRVLVDEVLLEPNSIPGPYFDGTYPGAVWEGTPHASRSFWDGNAKWMPAQDKRIPELIEMTGDLEGKYGSVKDITDILKLQTSKTHFIY